MKIADALLLQKDLSAEMNRLRKLAEGESHRFVMRTAEGSFEPNFDLEENHKRVLALSSQQNIGRGLRREW